MYVYFLNAVLCIEAEGSESWQKKSPGRPRLSGLQRLSLPCNLMSFAVPEIFIVGNVSGLWNLVQHIHSIDEPG